MKKPQLFQTFSAFCIGCLLLGTLTGSALANSIEESGSDSREPLLRPIKVVSTSGNVINADALVEDHEGYATLTMVQGRPAPEIILDYGRDVGGLSVFEVTSVSGTPKLQAIYSEAQQYLLPDGDAAAPGVPQNPQVAGDLTWAKGSVPTPYGSIEVSWEKEDNRLELKIFVPPGTSGTVGLPASSGKASLIDNGRTLAAVNKINGRPGYIYPENVGPGAHSFQLTVSKN